MPLLDLKYVHTNFSSIAPYTKNGILIDTSVIKLLLNGFIELRFSKKENPDYTSLILFLDKLKVKNDWAKFLITPHILTEACNHFKNDYNKRQNYKELVWEILPIIEQMNETEIINKEKILKFARLEKPILEIGDISIFLTSENYANQNRKISVLTNDRVMKERLKENPNVLVMHLNTSILDMIQMKE